MMLRDWLRSSYILLVATQLSFGAPVSRKDSPQPSGSSKTDKVLTAITGLLTSNFGNNILVYFPAFSTDPNAGPTYGVLPVLLRKNKENIVKQIMAPSITHNAIFGTTGTFRYYYYPNPNAEVFFFASRSQETNSRYALRYLNTELFDGWLYIRGYMGQETDGAERFFGFGPQSKESAESNYTIKDREMSLTLGLTLPINVRLSLTNSFHSVEVFNGPIDDLAKITESYPSLPGLGTEEIFSQRLAVVYDTRDFLITPTKGVLAEVYADFASQNAGGNFLFQRYGVDYRLLIPKGPKGKYTSALRILTDIENGDDVPFYAQASLGGDSTLRGYGEMRFIDRGRLLVNWEERIRFAQLEVFDVSVDFEVTPFIDVGAVFHEYKDIAAHDLRPVGGIALRTAVRPSVVGSFDFGLGEDGPAVFVGIDYAF